MSTMFDPGDAELDKSEYLSLVPVQSCMYAFSTALQLIRGFKVRHCVLLTIIIIL